MTELPEVGSRWRSPGLTHPWVVDRVGEKYVWLRKAGGYGALEAEMKCLKAVWPGGWRAA